MLEIFGAVAAAAMVTCYALEGRGGHYTVAFSASCAAASVYAFAIGSWPFCVLEAVWAMVALRRGIRRLAHPPKCAAPA